MPGSRRTCPQLECLHPQLGAYAAAAVSAPPINTSVNTWELAKALAVQSSAWLELDFKGVLVIGHRRLTPDASAAAAWHVTNFLCQSLSYSSEGVPYDDQPYDDQPQRQANRLPGTMLD